MTTVAILTAAGAGARLGRDVPKALVSVAGDPLVVHAARRLAQSGVIDAIIVTAPEGLTSQMTYLVGGDEQVTVPVGVVVGGATRQESVAAGLGAVGEVAAAADLALPDVILVHDAARPFASPELIRRVVAVVRAGHVAVVPGLPVTDTIKIVRPVKVPGRLGYAAPESTPEGMPADGPSADPEVDLVDLTPDRASLRAIQTPQGFSRVVLERAHLAGTMHFHEEGAASDDAGLVEELGEPVVVVLGEEAAMKITTELDLHVAEYYAKIGP